jgi:hypothetical protein
MRLPCSLCRKKMASWRTCFLILRALRRMRPKMLPRLPRHFVVLEELGSAATIATHDAGLLSTGLVSSVITAEATIQIRCLRWWAVRRKQSASSDSNNCSHGSMTSLVTQFYWMLVLALEHLPQTMVNESIVPTVCHPRLRIYTRRLRLHSAVLRATMLSAMPVALTHHAATSSNPTNLAAPPSQHHASQHQACPTCPT